MPRKRAGRGVSSNSRGSTGTTVLAFVLGAGAAAGAGYLYLHSRPQSPLAAPPVEVAPKLATHSDPPPPSPPAPRSAPFGTSEDVFEAGAHLYAGRCSSCHGTPTEKASTQPPAQQFWRGGRAAVAREAPGDLYSQIATGSPAKGMPAYAHTLTETQIWQIALLLKSADQDLPDPVVTILNTRPKPQRTE